MPYLESNQDASNQDLYNKAILGAAAIVGAAALGQGMSKNLTRLLDNWGNPKTGKAVAKKLYGDAADTFTPQMRNQISTVATDPKGPRFDIRKSMLGHDKVRRTDGSWYENLKTNHFNKDVKAFNKQLKNLYNGEMGDGVFSGSKLSIYEDVMKNSHEKGINLNSKQGTKLTENIYGSDDNSIARRAAGIFDLADDAEFTSSIWGDLYPDSNKNTLRNPNKKRKLINKSKTQSPQPQSPKPQRRKLFSKGGVSDGKGMVNNNIGVREHDRLVPYDQYKDDPMAIASQEGFNRQTGVNRKSPYADVNPRTYDAEWQEMLNEKAEQDSRKDFMSRMDAKRRQRYINKRDAERAERRAKIKQQTENDQFADAILNSGGKIKVEGIDF